MDPEIAEARARKEEQERKHQGELMTVAAACDLWIDRTTNKLGDQASVADQYRWLKKKLVGWAQAHGITNVQEITTVQLERWYASKEWQFADTTRAQRWGILRSMFAFFADRGVLTKSPADPIERCEVNVEHVQGPYTDAQVNKIMASIEKSVPFNLPLAKRPSYAPRIQTFMNLLLGTGCDVSDAVLHQPSRLEVHKVEGKNVYVYRYKRIKTDVVAVIPISAALAAELKSVPLEAGIFEGMPFRTQGLKLKLNQKVWSNRIAAVLETAEVKWVELPGRDDHGRPMRKAANVKQFRHTFAVRQLREGQRPEEVARMLGHVDTEMVLKHYAPWVKDLDTAHITRVVSVRSR